ncbi:MAG: hypothetical protein NTX06_12905 [Proteobacteria bacterium]|nr:hypothetical protein [Pseudomonadota bacterium]
MKRKTALPRITAILSLVLGLLFFFTMLVTIKEQRLQIALLGFLIGASIAWLVYLALWFIGGGVSRTMFPGLSRLLIMKLKQKASLNLSGYQEKMLIETVGAFLTISSILVLAAAAFFIISGILYIVGRLSW